MPAETPVPFPPVTASTSGPLCYSVHLTSCLPALELQPLAPELESSFFRSGFVISTELTVLLSSGQDGPSPSGITAAAS